MPTAPEARPQTKAEPRAIALLKQDHRTLERLFDEFEKTKDERRKREIVQETILRLTIHTRIEEEILYPALRKELDPDLIDEAIVEHNAAKQLADELQEMEPSDEMYDARFKVMSEQVKHHVCEEETEMFPEAQQTKADLDALGARLETRQQQLLDEVAAKGEIKGE